MDPTFALTPLMATEINGPGPHSAVVQFNVNPVESIDTKDASDTTWMTAYAGSREAKQRSVLRYRAVFVGFTPVSRLATLIANWSRAASANPNEASRGPKKLGAPKRSSASGRKPTCV